MPYVSKEGGQTCSHTASAKNPDRRHLRTPSAYLLVGSFCGQKNLGTQEQQTLRSHDLKLVHAPLRTHQQHAALQQGKDECGHGLTRPTTCQGSLLSSLLDDL